MRFRVASSHVQTIRGNFPRKYQNKSLSCPGCSNDDLVEVPSVQSQAGVTDTTNQIQPRDTQSHLLVCNSYSDIRSAIQLDPMDDGKLADFFIQVVQRRIENGED